MNVLFIDKRHAAASQLAETLAKEAGLSARSAGFDPAIRIDGVVARKLSDDDGTRERAPRALNPADLEWAHVVVSIGCNQTIAPPGDYVAVEWHLPECAAGLPQDLAPQLRRLIVELVMDLAGLPTPGSHIPRASGKPDSLHDAGRRVR